MKPQEKHNIKKQELFHQITALIEREGYENITIRGICKELNISTGTFYHYFPEKDDLITALFVNIDDYFLYEVTKQFTEDESENLTCYCRCYGQYILRNGIETCRCISVAPLTSKDHNFLEENRHIYTVLEGILLRGQQKGQFHFTLSTIELTRMLLVLMRGYSTDWAKRNGCYDLMESLNSFITLFKKSII